MRRWHKAALTGVGALTMYIAISYKITSMVTKTSRSPLEDCPADYGAHFEDVRFLSRRGDVMLDGWYMPGRVGMPTIVFVHGVSSTRAGCGMTELAAMLNVRGFGALLFDLRGHGKSGDGRMSGGWHERQDVLGAYDYLTTRGVAPNSIGLFGLSMGAGAAALAASEQAEIRALTLDGPYARASEMIAQEASIAIPALPEWVVKIFQVGATCMASKLFDIDIAALAPVDAVRTLGYPTLVICETEDVRISPEQTRRVYDACASGSELWMVEGVRHGEAFTERKEEYAERIADYFMSRLTSVK